MDNIDNAQAMVYELEEYDVASALECMVRLGYFLPLKSCSWMTKKLMNLSVGAGQIHRMSGRHGDADYSRAAQSTRRGCADCAHARGHRRELPGALALARPGEADFDKSVFGWIRGNPILQADKLQLAVRIRVELLGGVQRCEAQALLEH